MQIHLKITQTDAHTKQTKQTCSTPNIGQIKHFLILIVAHWNKRDQHTVLFHLTKHK